MPWGLKRFQEARCLHFVTFSCFWTRSPSWHSASPRHLRANFRADAAMVWILRLWIRGHARTRSFAVKRTGTGQAFRGAPNAQAECGATLALAGGRSVVAAAILRLQCVERRQAD